MLKGLKMLESLNPYLWAVKLRNWAYDSGLMAQCKVSVPVISVGNLSVGGSGKSSLVRYIANMLSENLRVCILSRGYKRSTKGTLLVSEWGRLKASWQEAGDEPYMLAKLLPRVSLVVDEVRCRGADFALRELKPELIILDDGFQHRKIHRDLDLLLLKKRDFSDRVLPFGRLREPFEGMKRADAFVLSFGELEDFEWRHARKPTFKMRRSGWRILRSTDHRQVENYHELSFLAFCGLGDNEQFFQSLRRLGVRLEDTIGFPDHYHYRGFKLQRDKLYITTLKDLVKLEPAENLFYLDFEVEVEGLKEFLESFIINRLQRVGSSAGRATDS